MNLKKGRWVLYPDVLLRLAQNMEKNQTLLPINRADGVKEYKIALRSAASKEIVYEISIELSRMSGNIQIFAGFVGQLENKVVVYENGNIVRWGSWVEELMMTLPSLIATAAKQASTESGDIDVDDATFGMIERELRATNLITFGEREDLRDLGGVPIHVLE